MKIEDVPISSIKPYDKALRENDAAVDGVAESIRQFGFQQPLVIDSNDTIIVGNTRYKAAKQIGMDSVPCVRADQLTERQIKAYRVLDNKLNELATWNFALLREEINSADCDFTDFGATFEFPALDLSSLTDAALKVDKAKAESELNKRLKELHETGEIPVQEKYRLAADNSPESYVITFGNCRIQSNEEEYLMFKKRLEEYITETAGSIGFINSLLAEK